MKKQSKNDDYTYFDERNCLHCGSLIPDQAHKGRLYCEREVLRDGSIKSCKDDFWSANRSTQLSEGKLPLLFHQQMSQSIRRLLELSLPEYDLEMLDRVGIRLDSSLKMEACEDGTINFYFIGYCINVNIISYKIKISKHDREFFQSSVY